METAAAMPERDMLAATGNSLSGTIGNGDDIGIGDEDDDEYVEGDARHFSLWDDEEDLF